MLVIFGAAGGTRKGKEEGGREGGKVGKGEGEEGERVRGGRRRGDDGLGRGAEQMGVGYSMRMVYQAAPKVTFEGCLERIHCSWKHTK